MRNGKETDVHAHRPKGGGGGRVRDWGGALGGLKERSGACVRGGGCWIRGLTQDFSTSSSCKQDPRTLKRVSHKDSQRRKGAGHSHSGRGITAVGRADTVGGA